MFFLIHTMKGWNQKKFVYRPALCYKADESADESKKVSFSKTFKSEIKIG
jgi:hypothetical protein